jgi:HK97 family phage portal protein
VSRWIEPLERAVERLQLPSAARREIQRFDGYDRTPVPLARPMPGGRQTLYGDRSGAELYLTYLMTYGQDSVVWSIASRLAEKVGSVPWKLWQRAASGKIEDRKQVTSHAVLDLLAKPNDFQSLSMLIEQAQIHFELVGESDVILGFFENVAYPLDMWVLRPDRLTPVPDMDRFLAGWVYTSPDRAQRIPLDNRELLRVVRPSATDAYRGQGAVQALLRDLDAQRFTKEWQAAFFENSARPGGIIKIDRHLNDEQWRQMNQRWRESHQGVGKAHRVAMLEHGADWVETQLSMRDMQMVELDNASRDKTLTAFGMPKSMLGIVEDVNRANAEAGQYLYSSEMIKPRLDRWRSTFNHSLLPLFGTGVRSLELDYEDPTPANHEAELQELDVKARVVVTLVGAGMDASKVLEMVEWPDLGYAKPEPAVVPMPVPPGKRDGQQDDGRDVSRETSRDGGRADARFILRGLDTGADEWDEIGIDAAMRWKVVGHPDKNCCEPCQKNLGRLYRNRTEAYSDYPNGRAYIKCVGEEFGNHCRCRVIKRKDGR